MTADTRALPEDEQAEQALLGAMLLARTAIDAAVNVGPGHYSRPRHGHIHAAIAELAERGDPTDPHTVADHLRRQNLLDDIGGQSYLTTLQEAVPAIGSAGRYATIVRELGDLRAAMHEAREVLEAGYRLDTRGARVHAEAAAQHLEGDAGRRRAQHIGQVLDEWCETKANPDATDTIATGFHDLDTILGGGFRPGQLIVVAGRTSMGKSVLGLTIAANAARDGHPTVVYSVEMAALELADRLVSSTSRISASTIRDNTISTKDWERITPALLDLAELPLWIDDTDSLTVGQIAASARSLATPPKLIVVDYVQILSAAKNHDNRAVEVGEITGALKRLARRLEIPIVALAQLNRSSDARQDKRPVLSDLRESGSIENDADVVIGLYRDEYYNPKTDRAGVLDASVMKQRNGPRTSAALAWLGDTYSIANLFAPGRDDL